MHLPWFSEWTPFAKNLRTKETGGRVPAVSGHYANKGTNGAQIY